MRQAAQTDVARVDDLSWGTLCYSPERRGVVDEVLLRLAGQDEMLENHLGALPTAAPGPAEIAAVHAWFVAALPANITRDGKRPVV